MTKAVFETLFGQALVKVVTTEAVELALSATTPTPEATMELIRAAAADKTLRNLLRKSLWPTLASLSFAAVAAFLHPLGDPAEKAFTFTIVMTVLLFLIVLATTCVFTFLNAILTHFNAGIQRIGITLFIGSMVYFAYTTLTPWPNWYVIGYARYVRTIEWSLEGCLQVCLWSTIALTSYVTVVAAIAWIISGFRQQ